MLSRWKNFRLAFTAALMFCLVLWAGFIPSVLAKSDSDWSEDETAYAYVEGTIVGIHVTDEYHYGMVTDDPSVGTYGTPYTEFFGGTAYNDHYDLLPGKWAENDYSETVLAAITTTYSGASDDASECTAEAIVTGIEP